MKKVARLFHCTMSKNLEPILKKGVIPSEWSGVAYMTDNKDGAYSFMSMRANEEIRDEKELEIKGFRFFDKLYVLEIDAKNLNWKIMDEGNDHNPLFFNNAGAVYIYPRKINLKDIVNVWECDVKTGESREHGLNPPVYNVVEQLFPV